jgi:hypothetical protein
MVCPVLLLLATVLLTGIALFRSAGRTRIFSECLLLFGMCNVLGYVLMLSVMLQDPTHDEAFSVGVILRVHTMSVFYACAVSALLALLLLWHADMRLGDPLHGK